MCIRDRNWGVHAKLIYNYQILYLDRITIVPWRQGLGPISFQPCDDRMDRRRDRQTDGRKSHKLENVSQQCSILWPARTSFGMLRQLSFRGSARHSLAYDRAQYAILQNVKFTVVILYITIRKFMRKLFSHFT